MVPLMRARDIARPCRARGWVFLYQQVNALQAVLQDKWKDAGRSQWFSKTALMSIEKSYRKILSANDVNGSVLGGTLLVWIFDESLPLDIYPSSKCTDDGNRYNFI